MLKNSKIRDCFNKKSYFFVFVIAFFVMAITILPIIIVNGGVFIYYGDYNSQQIPFYMHSHEMVRSMNFGWDWGTDLGTAFVPSYSFYLLGSPFFWLTVPFPTSFVSYLMPWILCLKTGVAAVTSYALIKRFVKGNTACIIGALLYALSAFQGYNVFFNHFHDVVAFFPLLLLALEMTVKDNKRGIFALAVALTAIVNYYFFVAQVVFVIIYFAVRCLDKEFNITLKKLGVIVFESILGFMASLFIVLPSVLAIVDNPRVDRQLLGLDMIVYNDKFRILRIIQSFFMLPDPPARANVFSSTTARWASIAGYLPLFSLSAFFAMVKSGKKHWTKTLFIVSAIFACVPILNAAFQLFNSTYYARWFFMPVLITAIMTAYVIDNKEIDLKKGVPACIIGFAIFIGVSLLPSTDKDVVKYGNIAEYKDLWFIQVVITLACTAMLIYVAYYALKKSGNIKKVLTLTVVACTICTAGVVWYGAAQGPYLNEYKNEMQNVNDEITLERPTNDNFFRIDITESKDNYPMFWGYSSMRTFHSIVSNSIIEFYEEAGITRDVASRVEQARYPLRSLFSVKYFFAPEGNDKVNLKGFELMDTQGGYDIYLNEYFVPMGFTYDYYTTKDDIKSQKNDMYDRALVKAIVLDEMQELKYSKYLDKLPDIEIKKFSDINDYYEDCEKRASSASSSFEYDSNSFKSTINLDKENLVFFSVPYDEGWQATVNDKKADVEKVSNGFMAVLADEGDNVIEFTFRLTGFTEGLIASLLAVILYVGYMIFMKKNGVKVTASNSIDYSESYEDENVKIVEQNDVDNSTDK